MAGDNRDGLADLIADHGHKIALAGYNGGDGAQEQADLLAAILANPDVVLAALGGEQWESDGHKVNVWTFPEKEQG